MPNYRKVKKQKKGYNYTRKGKKISVPTHSQHYRVRVYKPISRSKAMEEFEKRSERSKTLDKKNKAKETKEKPDREWLENINRFDVEGIDTPELTPLQKEKEFEKLLSNRYKFYEDFEINDSKEDLKDQFEYANAIYDYSRISLLSTQTLFKNSGLGKSLQENNTLEKKGTPDEIVLFGSTLFYKVGDNFYLKNYVDKGIEGLNEKNLKMQTKHNEEFPLVLSDNQFVYAVSPRIIEEEEEGIKMNIQEFEEETNNLRKKYTKKELGSKMGYSTKEINQYLKDELVLHYLWDTKQRTKLNNPTPKFDPKYEEELATKIINLNHVIKKNERELKNPIPSWAEHDPYGHYRGMDFDQEKGRKGVTKQKERLKKLINEYEQSFGSKTLEDLKADMEEHRQPLIFSSKEYKK